MKFSLGFTNFLEEISSLSHSNIFLISLPWSLGRLLYLSLLFFGSLHSHGYIFTFLLCLFLVFFSQLFGRPPQTTILPFRISFSWGWSWSLPPVQCHLSLSIVLQALCLSDIIPWIYCHSHSIIIRDLIRSYLNGLVAFLTFFNLRLHFSLRSSWSEQSAPGFVFADCIECLHLQLQRI